MTIVKFTRSFRGVATAEVFYEKGQEVDLPEWQASRVVAEGAAERVAAPLIEAGPELSDEAVDSGPVVEESAPPKPARKSTRKKAK